MDLPSRKIIKRFRPHQMCIEVMRWVDGRFPEGVYMSAPSTYGKVLRYRHAVHVPDAVDRAVKMAEKEKSLT